MIVLVRRKRKVKKGIKEIFFLFVIIMLMVGIGLFFLNNKSTNTIKKNSNKNSSITTSGEAKKKLDRAPSNNGEFKNLSDGEYETDKGFVLVIKDGVAYIENNIIVNKTYSLPSDYVPTDPYQEITGNRGNKNINKNVMEAFKLMESDARAVGLNIYISSGYRGYTYQESLYNNYVSRDGKEAADRYSARPGYSEHQSGTCFDLNTIDDSFAYTNEGKWISENAYLYGFIIRYPKGKEDSTGYQYESWHLRYVGRELASKLYNNGDWLTIEEYYGISSSY